MPIVFGSDDDDDSDQGTQYVEPGGENNNYDPDATLYMCTFFGVLIFAVIAFGFYTSRRDRNRFGRSFL